MINLCDRTGTNTIARKIQSRLQIRSFNLQLFSIYYIILYYNRKILDKQMKNIRQANEKVHANNITI